MKNLNKNSNPKTTGIKGPWHNNPFKDDKESFFQPLDILPDRWAKFYPYRLLVVEVFSDNGKAKYRVVGAGESSEVKIRSYIDNKFLIAFEPLNRWSFQLPITPQQLSIINSFAINNSSSLRGIVEEHNGTKFKIINCSGTFGVWPYRRSKSDPPGSPRNSIQTLFGGTIQAASALQAQSQALIRSLQGKTLSEKPKPVNEDDSQPAGLEGTGYAQALLLDQFLEQYSEIKKHPKAANYRLAFDIPKQNQTYLVTPIQFTYSQSADSPNEYRFNLQLKAFKRISVEQGYGAAEGVLKTPNPLENTTLQNILNSITQARKTLSGAYNLVKSVRSDANTAFNALRETALFVKGLMGLYASMADLPENIIADAKFSIADAYSNLKEADAQRLAITNKIAGTIKTIKSTKKQNEGQSFANLSKNENTSASLKTSPVNNIFSNPVENFDFLNSLNTDSVNFNSATKRAIDAEIDRVSLTTVDDLQKHKSVLQELAYQISDAFGTGNATFSQIYKKSTPKERIQDISIDEYQILKNLYDAIQNLGILTINNDVNQNQNAAYEFVKAEANDAGIVFEDSDTKIRVPVPFGLTMEQIAAKYLADQERWIEIATLNALKSPYIDEDGFIKNFLSNGSGRQFNVTSNTDLYVGQKIIIFSDTQPRQKRTIIKIEKISDTNFLVEVDGLANLEIFTLSDNAKILAYLPGTINSQDQIFIPSDLPVTDNLITRPVPVTQSDALTGLSRIDLLLTDSNDIAVNSLGELRLSYGITNLFQALKIKFITESGNLIRHPDYGSGISSGMSTAEMSASEIYNTISLLIAQDSRFSGIERLQVNVDGPYADIRMSVYIADGLGVFPISFRLAM
jgi:hypothetical protein